MTRPGPRQRGYTTAHDRERARWAPRVDAGLVDCWRCTQPIEPGRPWDLGHNDDRTAWNGPEHRHCNRSAAGIKGNQVTRAIKDKATVRTSRDW
jgi:hypothetical protein